MSRVGATLLTTALFLGACTPEGAPGDRPGSRTETGRDGDTAGRRSPGAPAGNGSGADGRGSRRDGGFDPDTVRLGFRTVADGFQAPLLVTNAGDGSGLLYVVEQGGTVRVVDGRRARPEPFLDITELTEAGGEQGLLGLAFHPSYEDNGRLFVNYTDNNGDTVVAQYRRRPSDPATADPRSEQVLLTIDQPWPNHNGGHLAFGPDGHLYVAVGDGGAGGDPQENAQDLGTLLGKLLRIDVDSGHRPAGPPYAVPSDNPFAGDPAARGEIWAYGLRNPWRFSFDPARGSLWIADVGQDELEEVNRAPAGRAGANYGWDDMEGTACYEPESGCKRSGRALPVAQYSHATGGCSVTGGYVYGGASFPALRGAYVFGDFCSGAVYGIPSGATPTERPAALADTDYNISSFGLDEAGELYLTDLSSGAVVQVQARGS